MDYISQFVELEEKNGEFWGLSPFREEKTPSFSVRRESGKFYDFSSGIGGSVLTFVKRFNRCTNGEAINILKRFAGCEGESFLPSKKLSATIACKKFKPPNIKKSKQPKEKFYPDNCMEKYERPTEKLSVWEREGISREVLDRFQVCYDRFSNRLVYPIRNMEGEIVNIGGRTLDADFKAKKLRKYTYFSGWGEMNIVYALFDNLNAIRSRKEIIIFEGCKSVLLAATWGIQNTGALLTSHLNPRQTKILAKLGCRVVFALDKDVRIRDDHNIKVLKNYVQVEYIYDATDMLADKDAPVDKGQEVFEKLYEQRLKL